MRVPLGQNFLTSTAVVRRIVEAADIKTDDVILEIGPGKGILTGAILEKNFKKLIAVEKDVKFADLLNEKFSENKNFEIIFGDILKILENPVDCLLLAVGSYKIVANIPYYITSRLLRLIFSQKNLPERIVLMVQKEVAERICARPPHMNLLALSVQAYGRPKIVFRVSRRFFKPCPRVDSAVVVIDNISHNFFKLFRHRKSEDEAYFFQLLHTGFRQKRKFLLSNLKNSIPKMDGSAWIKAFGVCGLNAKSRAENLSLENWGCLVLNL